MNIEFYLFLLLTAGLLILRLHLCLQMILMTAMQTGWTTYSGTWAVQNNEYSVEAGSGVKAVANGTNFTNFTYEADVKVSSGAINTNAGLIFRTTNAVLEPIILVVIMWV